MNGFEINSNQTTLEKMNVEECMSYMWSFRCHFISCLPGTRVSKNLSIISTYLRAYFITKQ